MVEVYKGKGLVIPSQLSAVAELNHWEASRTQEYIQDQDGCSWQILASLEPGPLEGGVPGDVEWKLRVVANLVITSSDISALFEDSSAEDRVRMQELIGEHKIPIHMNDISISVPSEEHGRQKYVECFQELKEKLSRPQLRKIKCHKVIEWIEKTRVFGSDK